MQIPKIILDSICWKLLCMFSCVVFFVSKIKLQSVGRGGKNELSLASHLPYSYQKNQKTLERIVIKDQMRSVCRELEKY